MEDITGRLENWYIEEAIGFKVIFGNIFEDIHRRWPEGLLIHTSKLVKGSICEEGSVVTTLNSKYLLGKPLLRTYKPNEDYVIVI